LNAKTDFSENIIKALVVLHNFVRERGGYNFCHTLYLSSVSNECV